MTTIREDAGIESSGDTVAELRANRDLRRAQLGDTVEALAAKVDVKARARRAALRTKARVRRLGDDGVRIVSRSPARAGAIGGGAVAAVGAVGGLVLLRRHRQKARARRWWRR